MWFQGVMAFTNSAMFVMSLVSFTKSIYDICHPKPAGATKIVNKTKIMHCGPGHDCHDDLQNHGHHKTEDTQLVGADAHGDHHV